MPDLPIAECMARADEAIANGATVYQKWTCRRCKSRQTMPDANTFYGTGVCEECDSVTDIATQGCGFAAVFSFNGDPL